MAIAGGAASLGVAMAAAAGSVDAAGIAAWAAIGAVICAQLPAFCGVFTPTAGTPMASVAGVINSGSGGFTVLPGEPMGLLMAVAAGSLDSVGIAKWTSIGAAIVSWMGAYGSYGPAGLIGYTGLGTGPVTGLGQVQFTNELIGPDLAAAAGSTDEVGIAKWTAIGAAIISTIKTLGQIAPTTMTNPGTGGPVVGAGTFT